jgi:hypothetical protein
MASSIVSEAAIVETRKQHVGVGVTQSLNASIKTIREQTCDESNIEVVRRGILIRSTTILGSGLGGVLVGRNLS